MFEETCQTEEILVVRFDDSQLVTLQLESGNFIRFQPDTGAQCNVLPLHVYKLASDDHGLEKVKSADTSLVVYEGSKIKVIQHVTIRVWRNKVARLLDCRVVENREIRPNLGQRACLGKNIIQYNDKDKLQKPRTDEATVYNVDPNPRSVLTYKEIVAKFPTEFGDRVGQLDEEYTIRPAPNAQPV